MGMFLEIHLSQYGIEIAFRMAVDDPQHFFRDCRIQLFGFQKRQQIVYFLRCKTGNRAQLPFHVVQLVSQQRSSKPGRDSQFILNLPNQRNEVVLQKVRKRIPGYIPFVQLRDPFRDIHWKVAGHLINKRLLQWNWCSICVWIHPVSSRQYTLKDSCTILKRFPGLVRDSFQSHLTSLFHSLQGSRNICFRPPQYHLCILFSGIQHVTNLIPILLSHYVVDHL